MIRSEHIDRFRPSFAGLSFATVFLCVSLTPSLLPRTWVSQGLVSGIAAAIGYGTGVVLGWLTRKLVRVYAGLASAPSLADRATLAVRELVRTGAFSRKVLCVVFTTGTGWVDPRAASSLEYMYNGDSALVGMQYSTLPSWISFAVEREKSTAAARELFNRVYAQWSTLPPGQRPKLLVFGESLGSYGGEGAFSGIED